MQTTALQQQGAVLLAQSDGCSVWQFRGETGDGTMSVYEVLPGVLLSFNDFHMERFESSFTPGENLFAVDHCRTGRMEYAPADGMLAYTQAGDMKLDLRRHHTGTFVFPSHHYHGLTVAFDRDLAERALAQQVRAFPVTLEAVISRWKLGDFPCVIHNPDAAARVFEALYCTPERKRAAYFRVKVLELLLCLDAMELPQTPAAPAYFYRSQVETVKAIRAFLEAHVAENFTQQALSNRFGIPMTAMKACFRSVYGAAIGAWLTGHRMQLAAELLAREPELSIAEVGGRVGYDNAGKFTQAFKRSFHTTPSNYRRERGTHHEI